MRKPKPSKNNAKDIETPKPQAEKLYAMPSRLRQAIVDALLTGTPRNLSVGQVNQICNALNQLSEVK